MVTWQSRLDRWFPKGLVVSFEGASPGTTYLIPRVTVTRMSGDQPVVWLPVFSGSDKAFGPQRLDAAEKAGAGRLRVELAGNDRAMVWYSGVSSRAARAMAPDRARLMRLAPQGGEAVLHEYERSAGEGPHVPQ